MFNSGQILKLIGAIDDKLLEKSTSNMPLKPSWKSKDITPDESKQIFCRYEESLAIEKWKDYHLTPQSQLSLQGTFYVWTDIKVLLTKADHGEAGM